MLGHCDSSRQLEHKEDQVAAVEKLLGAEVASSLMILRDAYKFTMKQINALDKLLDALVEANEQARTMKTVGHRNSDCGTPCGHNGRH